jgi:hypothetical protein
MVGNFVCCARAASGHAAAPPSSAMKLRRFMQKCPSRTKATKGRLVRHSKLACRCLFWVHPRPSNRPGLRGCLLYLQSRPDFNTAVNCRCITAKPADVVDGSRRAVTLSRDLVRPAVHARVIKRSVPCQLSSLVLPRSRTSL